MKQLEWAFARCRTECRFFPSDYEIRQYALQYKTPEQHAEEIKDARRVEATRQAFIEGREAPQLKSVREDDVKRLAGEVLSREERLKLGIEEPRQLSPQEFEARIRELERQKEELLRQQKPEGKA